MAKFTQIACDACGKVLKGQKGIERFTNDNVAVNGMVTAFFSDGSYVHITRSANDALSFCSFECFRDFANRRIEQHEKENQEDLRHEVNSGTAKYVPPSQRRTFTGIVCKD